MLKFPIALIALALLAGAKIWAQDRLYRDGAQDALLRAQDGGRDPGEQAGAGVGDIQQTHAAIVGVGQALKQPTCFEAIHHAGDGGGIQPDQP